ncbi:MAG: HDIG domain-containing protein [Anaerolineaceae bacterium]|nr:HDIG domain-containing protein [Anaerolineaceae bacterium]
MNREEALCVVKEYVKNQNLINHMLSVEAAMKWYAERMAPNEVENWQIAGLLHDFDWEIHPSAESHPQDGIPILKQRGVSEKIIDAIRGHATHTDIPRTSLMAKALFACDEITGLVTACTLVRPSKSIYDLKVSSVKKKWKNKNFAAGANREEMVQAAQEFGIALWEHVGNIIASMKSIAPEIGLDGEN